LAVALLFPPVAFPPVALLVELLAPPVALAVLVRLTLVVTVTAFWLLF
jgi:hypothetical protein